MPYIPRACLDVHRVRAIRVLPARTETSTDAKAARYHVRRLVIETDAGQFDITCFGAESVDDLAVTNAPCDVRSDEGASS